MTRSRSFLATLALALASCQGGVRSRSWIAPEFATAAPEAPAQAPPTRIEYFQISDG